MTPERRAEIKARTDAATPGPWTWEEGGIERPGGGRFGPRLIWRPDGFCVAETHGVSYNQTLENIWPYDAKESDGIAKRDAAFIAASRTDVPDLLAEIERLRSIEERALQQVEQFKACDDAEVCASHDTAYFIVNGVEATVVKGEWHGDTDFAPPGPVGRDPLTPGWIPKQRDGDVAR